MNKVGLLATPLLTLTLASMAHGDSLTTLYRFSGKSDGGVPLGGVIADATGTTIYGETYLHGDLPCTRSPQASIGCGTLYSFSAAKGGGFKLLASFTGPNGANGNIAPVLIGNMLYGATQYGGAGSDGVVFSVHTDGTDFKLLHQFSGMDGSGPQALVAGMGGTLYGITEVGGSDNNGVLFSLTSAGIYTLIHTFVLPASAFPLTLVVAPNGTLVGSTEFGGQSSDACRSGCGTVFSYDPSTGFFKTILTFASSGLQQIDSYVGSVGPGPAIYGAGVPSIYSLSSPKGFLALFDTNYYGIGSGVLSGPVIAPNGILYGILEGGQTLEGEIYSVQNGVAKDLFYFSGGTHGSSPSAKPFLTKSGTLLGTTNSSTCKYCGTIWEYVP